MIKSLILIRHGESVWNASRIIQGQLDSTLSDTGKSQAEALKDWITPQAPVNVYSSDLMRAAETAELATGLAADQIHKIAQLREVNFGVWQGLSGDEVRQKYPQDWADYMARPFEFMPPGAESFEDFQSRVMECLTLWDNYHSDETIWAFTHGAMIRMFILTLLGLPIQDWRTLRVKNTSVTRLDFKKSGPFLRYFGLTEHLKKVDTA